MENVKLYLIVYETLDGEPDWFFTTKTDMSQNEAEQLALQNYYDFQEFEEDDKPSIDDCLGSVWYNLIDEADGYKITLTK